MDAIKRENSLLLKIAEVENLLYWKFFPGSGQWEFSPSFVKVVNQGIHEGEERDLFMRYVGFMEPADQQKVLNLIVSGSEVKEEVNYYPLQIGGKHYYHRCASFGFQEDGVFYIMGIISDITVEEREMRRNRNIVAAMSDFIFIIDDQYYIRDVIKSDLVQLFHTTEQLIGSHLGQIYSVQVTELFKEAIQECLHTRTLQEISYPLVYEGQDTYYNLRMVPYERDKVLAFIHEVTDRIRYSHELIKARKKADEENLLKSTFLADISHEIRTLVNVIVGFSGLMVQSDEQEERESYMEIVRRSDAQLLELIGDVLDFSRISQGKLKIRKELLNMNELLKEMACWYSSRQKEGVKLVLDIPEIDVEVFTDRNGIMQVLSNLLLNAASNTDKGEIIVRLEEKEDQIICSVQDTGKGIPANMQGVIFDRFQKLDEKSEGVGLGLAICKSLIEYLNGKIELQSEEGRGSVFSFCLPKEDKEYVMPFSTSNLEVEEKIIYVLTGVESSFMLLNQILQDEYSVHWISEFDILRNKFQNAVPDMILINQERPLADICALVAEIRDMAVQTPILLILKGENINERTLLELLNNGVTAVLSVPFTQKKILKLVHKLVSKN